jgi:hypothetical protein
MARNRLTLPSLYLPLRSREIWNLGSMDAVLTEWLDGPARRKTKARTSRASTHP